MQIPAAVLLHVRAAVHFRFTFPFRLADMRAETFAGPQLCRLVVPRSSSQCPKAAPDCGCLAGDCEVLACITQVVGSRVPTDRSDKAQGARIRGEGQSCQFLCCFLKRRALPEAPCPSCFPSRARAKMNGGLLRNLFLRFLSPQAELEDREDLHFLHIFQHGSHHLGIGLSRAPGESAAVVHTFAGMAVSPAQCPHYSRSSFPRIQVLSFQ